jgi:hypothetical protein
MGSTSIIVDLQSLLLTIISVKYYECVSVLLPWLSGVQITFLPFVSYYTVMWPVWLYHIFPHYLIKGIISEKKIFNKNMCFDFLYNFCLKHFPF